MAKRTWAKPASTRKPGKSETVAETPSTRVCSCGGVSFKGAPCGRCGR